MSAAVMTERLAEASPRFQARMAGVIALITTTSGFAAIVSGGLIVYSDAAATAHNILANETLFRLAVAGDVISLLYIAYTLLLYNLFRPVNRSLSLLAAFFSLVGTAVGAVNILLLLAPLVVLGGDQSLSALSVEQSQALALLFLKLHAQLYNIGLVLFGSYNLLIGYLIVRSTFLPRILGVLLAISGLCYLINSFANFLSPVALHSAARRRGTSAGPVARRGRRRRSTMDGAGQRSGGVPPHLKAAVSTRDGPPDVPQLSPARLEPVLGLATTAA